MAGYSSTPLGKKLGIREGTKLLAIAAPADYRTLLEPLPANVTFARKAGAEVNVVHLFTTQRVELQDSLTAWREQLAPDASVWVSWPKKASKRPSEITEDVIREIALPLGWVDVKVCAVDETWSGLKLVVRKALR